MRYLSILFVVSFLFVGCSNPNSLFKKEVVNCKKFPADKSRFDCYMEQAEDDDYKAQSWIAYYYTVGKIVPKNTELGKKWFAKASKTSKGTDGYSQRELGIIYLKEKNYLEAAKWFEKAYKNNDTTATRELAYLYQDGNGVQKDMTKAFKLFEEAAFQDDTYAQNSLGHFYRKGWGTTKDLKKALYWFRKTAAKNNAYGINEVGYAYAKGFGVERDYKEAVKWFRKSAVLNSDYSMGWLGYLYEMGLGVEKNIQEAKKWYIKSGNAYSKGRLQNLKLQGHK